MEDKLGFKLRIYSNAVQNFKDSLEIDLSDLSETIVDSIKSGRVQKFEFCIELLWKTIKLYIYEVNGIDAKSPKTAVKDFYNTGYISAEEYEQIIQMIDDRNELSHIYKKEDFELIYSRIIKTLPVLLNIGKIMTLD